MCSREAVAGGEKPLSGWNPSGSEDPSRPGSARLPSSQTSPEHPESERESTE